MADFAKGYLKLIDSLRSAPLRTCKSMHECVLCGQTIAQLQSELAAARCELQEHQASFDLRWKADMRAIERWRTEPAEKGWNISLGIEQDPETGERKLKVGLPADRSLTMPDHADLCVWLLKQWERADAAEVKAETAERAERRRADTNEQARVQAEERAERAEADTRAWKDTHAGLVKGKNLLDKSHQIGYS